MTDYTELVKMLRTCSERDSCVGWDKGCPYLGTGLCDDKAGKAADAIENLCRESVVLSLKRVAEQNNRSRWISVKERLPDVGEEVLCACRAGIVEVLKYFNGINGPWYKDSRHVYMSGFVTHWMPLPAPPKEEQT